MGCNIIFYRLIYFFKVRSFVGGLELICGLLESSDDGVLAACCFAIANIARLVTPDIMYLDNISLHIIKQSDKTLSILLNL